MRTLVLFGLAGLVAACAPDGTAPTGPIDQSDVPIEASLDRDDESDFRAAHNALLAVFGRGDHTRTVGAVTAVTRFKFLALQVPSGRAGGWYSYNFQAAGFSVVGPVTCLSVLGDEAWIGGKVGRVTVTTADPSLKDLEGADMWWRVRDARGNPAAMDSTTGLGFQFPGGTITADSWCRDQPRVLVMRAVERGPMVVKGGN